MSAIEDARATLARYDETGATRDRHDCVGALRNLLTELQPEIYIVQNEDGFIVDVFRDADEATAAYQGEGCSVIEETIWEPGEYAKYQATKCDECEEIATNFWPKLIEPVQMCDSCTHNARRSGWEPGQ